MRRVLLAAAAAAAAVLPAAAGGLEPRFDHSDSHGPMAGLVLARDSVVASGRTASSWRPALRAGWSVDVSGEGSELIVSADLALRSWRDPPDEHVLLSASARYRAYFGTEQWKTYFEAGLWTPLVSRFAAGPLVGVGVVHDFSLDFGVFAGGEFAPAFGEGRTVSFAGLAGCQFRFAIP